MVQAMGMGGRVIFSKGVHGFPFGRLTNSDDCKSTEVVEGLWSG